MEGGISPTSSRKRVPELAAAKNLKTFKALSSLAASLDLNAPGTRLTAAQLAEAVKADSAIADYMSESDYHPAFISAPWPTGGLDETNLKTVFNAELMTLFKDDLQYTTPPSTDLSQYLVKQWSPTDAKGFMARLSNTQVDDDQKPSAEAFGRILNQFKANLTDLQVYTVGPKGDDGKLGDSDGLYGYLVVGKSADGKAAGFVVGSVQT